MAARSRVLVGLALAVLGCRRASPPPPVDRGSDATLPETRTDLVRQDCSGIEPKVEGCGETHGAGDRLLRFSESLTELPARHDPPPPAFWEAARAAIAEAGDLSIATLGGVERVHVQNAALHVTVAADAAKETALARAAVLLVKRLSFDVSARRRADQPLQLEAWLGPRDAWTERSKGSPMFHETVFHQTRVVRIVRLPGMHANFTQLMAVDSEGHPFLTSVVGSLEIRRGEENTSPACVAITSPARVRCDVAAGLAGVQNLDELPKNHFFHGARDGRLPCNGCHTAVADDDGMLFGMASVDAGATNAELTRREALLAETVGRVLVRLWR